MFPGSLVYTMTGVVAFLIHFILLNLHMFLPDKWKWWHLLFVCIPSQQFSSHVGTEPTLPCFYQYCRELMCLAQGHNTVPLVGIETRTSRFGVRRSTTTPPRFSWLCSFRLDLSIVYKKTSINYIPLNPISYILIRKRNVKKIEIHFLEKDHFDGVLSDMANE